MDAATFATISTAFGALAPLGLIAAFAWVILRTKSRHILIRRLWQLVHGNQDIADPEIRAFVEEETSLASFQMFSGLWVRTLEEARQLLRWAKHNNVTIWSLRLCGEYFDVDARQIRVHKLPSKAWQHCKAAFAMLCYAILALGLWSMTSDYVPLKLNATQRVYLAADDHVRTFGSVSPFGPQPLKASACSTANAENANRTAFTEAEIGILCRVFKDADTAPLMKDARASQRWALWMIVLVAGWFLFRAGVSWASGEAATKIARRQLSPSLSEAQMTLDWGDVPNNGAR
ncbi:DUF6216 family protein [Variovorax fucosicus]|uniref:DUF6216 family protein n=1 Tax=Variovorax fucosicus TaxID=3053517 RepID=UPI00257812A7|nr:DUF6216 family protein [Variovorax sp. J22G47]MDM0055014.1 DUF6216 family protein [Variovorax sp. J22G47]